MNVFSTTKLNLTKLRECQSGGALAAQAHYAVADAERHTIMQLPTGTGKSALIAALPFYVPCERVLVLVPNLDLIKQMEEDLDMGEFPGTNVYEELDMLTPAQVRDMEMHVLKLTKKVNRTDIQEHHIIVANYQKFQDVEKYFGTNKDLIDLIIIDEAHHQAAKTYQELLKFFGDAKVIGLTATPFRTDGKKLEGKKIYTYHFRDAVDKKYIRNINMNNVAPSKLSLTFTEEGSSEIYTLEQVTEMSEQSWFNRGIALSQDCCDSIADMAVAKLQKLKKDFPETDHQIIAAAISIRHARVFLKPAFERHNLRIGMVSSDEKDRPNNAKVKSLLKQGKLDVIINVGMLGEGFNQPTLGVAAIFRPYKTLNPYIQFIGRVIRRNGLATHCYVVSHLGLNQVKRFNEFKLFDVEDAEFMKKLLAEAGGGDGSQDVYVPDGQPEPDGTEDSGQIEPKDTLKISQSGDLMDVGGIFVDDAKIQSQLDGFSSLSPDEKAKFLKTLGVDSGQISEIIPKKIKPIQKRLAAKTQLNELAKSVTTDIMKAIGIKMKGRDLTKMTTNFIHIQKMVNNRIDKAMGIGKGERNNLTIAQLEDFQDTGKLAGIQDELTPYFEGKLAEQRAK